MQKRTQANQLMTEGKNAEALQARKEAEAADADAKLAQWKIDNAIVRATIDPEVLAHAREVNPSLANRRIRTRP